MNNVDYLCKGMNAKALSGNISEVALSVTMCSWVNDLKC